MDIASLENHIEASQRKLELLSNGTGDLSQNDLLLDATESLSSTLEELSVSIEELKQQREEIDHVYEIAIRERKNYQELFEFAPDAYLVTDRYGTIEKANQNALSLFNIKPDFVVGKPIFSFIADSQRSSFRKVLAESSEKKEHGQWKTEIQPRDREICPAQVSIAPIYEQKELKGWLMIIRDLTEQQQAEETRRALELEKELNELKSHFLRRVSHEFRTPLNIIHLSSQLLQRLNITPDFKQQLHDRMGNAVRQMTQMIEDVVCVTRNQSQVQSFRPQPIDVKEISLQLIEEQQFLKDGSDRIQFECELESFPISGDPELLKQIFGNLISNALKYSPDESIVKVKLYLNEQHLVFTVIDKGIGIPKADQEELFDCFYRAGNVVGIPGTGLGMAIVQTALQLHQGKIEFESEPGVGSTFTVKIPINCPIPPQQISKDSLR